MPTRQAGAADAGLSIAGAELALCLACDLAVLALDLVVAAPAAACVARHGILALDPAVGAAIE